MKMYSVKRIGFTITEVMLASAVLAIGVFGTLSYRSRAALDARRADIEMTAGRMGLKLLQDWRAENGSMTYDPVSRIAAPGITVIQTGSTGLTMPSGYDTILGQYKITVDGITYRVMLSSQVAVAGSTPRALSVQIGWRMDRSDENLTDTDKVIRLATFLDN